MAGSNAAGLATTAVATGAFAAPAGVELAAAGADSLGLLQAASEARATTATTSGSDGGWLRMPRRSGKPRAATGSRRASAHRLGQQQPVLRRDLAGIVCVWTAYPAARSRAARVDVDRERTIEPAAEPARDRTVASSWQHGSTTTRARAAIARSITRR